MIFLIFTDYEILSLFYIPIYITSIFLLIIVMLFGFGEEQWGARSWLNLGFTAFQPSELVKFGLIIFLAKIIEKNQDSINSPLTLLKIMLLSILPIYLILLQPDFGTAMVFVFITFIMLFIAGLNYKYIITFFGAGIASIPVLYFTLEKYQINRIRVFLNPELDPNGSGYHVIQSKIAIGSGMIRGRGLFNGIQNQYGFLPAKETDFIFAVLGEELGLAGALLLIVLYGILFYRLIITAKKANTTFGSLIVIGVLGVFLFHVFENIGMTIGLVPVTGIPLPFISYGGTFMLSNMISIGLVLSVGMKKDELEF